MMATTGYELLVAAAASLTGKAIFNLDTEPSDAELSQFVNANQAALDRARLAIRQGCSVPLEYDAGYLPKYADKPSILRDVARSLAMESKAAERLGDFPRAVAIGLDIFVLANSARQGGLVVDCLVAIAIESIGIAGVRRILHLVAVLLRLQSRRLARQNERSSPHGVRLPRLLAAPRS
jgi:hypothetical protein